MNTDAATPDPRFSDPLSEVTRRERKFLLATSSAGLAVVLLRAVPKGIPSIGLDELTGATQRGILWAIAIVVFYALVAFIVYAWSDFVIWRKAVARFDIDTTRAIRDAEADPAPTVDEPGAIWVTPSRRDPALVNALNAGLGRHSKWTRHASRISCLRAAWEFVMPIVVGAAALGVVLSGAAAVG